ncbi:MAG: copper chaperone PCu(A)C [Sphingomonas sp.]|uniref:copper chaperone PCu(A)C n=1 Tax=Sphingomonas sp. TaxID=28214 RepID=UPI00262DA5CC|nr:copper chaperone PCu(A)C [Sphingomonas sp.]MDK2769351.1 copper chaperone PCu(A)C [Sphingomonas sp.]
MRSFVVAVMAAVTLAGCEQAQLGVEDAWVRLPAVSSRPGAAYFTVKGGSEATSLLGVSSPAAVRTELHEMKHENGMMTMSPLKDVAIPAGATVKFEPGGKHVMLYDLSPELRAGGKIPLRLAFANGKTVEIEAELRAPGQEK